MTASIHSRHAAEPADRPRAPVASAVVVLAALLVGVGALAMSSILSSDVVRVLIALVLVAAGVWVARPASDGHHPLTLAIGAHVLRGVGTSFAVLGAYLGGLALLTASIPEGAVLSTGSGGPSPTAVILMVYGIPALALLAVATTGVRAWTAGAGAILPMIAVLLLATAGAGVAAISVTMLVVGAVLTVFVVRAPGGSPWGDLASAAAAMATSFAFGAGTSPFGTLGATQLGGAPGADPAGRLSVGALGAVLAGSLLVAAILLLVSVVRRDLAGGVLAGSIFAGPMFLLLIWRPPGPPWPGEVLIALAGVPILVALVALAAIRVPRFRDAIVAVLPMKRPAAPNTEPPATDLPDADLPDAEPPVAASPDAGRSDAESLDAGSSDAVPLARRPDTESLALNGAEPHADAESSDVESSDAESSGAELSDTGASDAERSGASSVASAEPRGARPSGAIATAACAVVVAAAVVATVLVVPAFGWGLPVQGAVALVVLAGAGALGYWLPATPGAAAAIVALLGLALAPPFARLLTTFWTGFSETEFIIGSALDLAAAAVVAWLLTRRHPHPGVFAAAAYTLAGSTATFLGSLFFNPRITGIVPYDGVLGPITIVALPLVLLGLAAAIALFRGHLATGQAVGAVVLAAAGFVPLKVLAGQLTGGELSERGFAVQYALTPLTPTDSLHASAAFSEVTGPVLVAVLVMVMLALVFATSLAIRPSGPLAGAVALLLLAAVQTGLLSVLSTASTDDAELLGQVLGGLAAIVAVIAVATAGNAARRN